jgi:transposase-like protein
MDAATFETWLGAIAALNDTQRRRVFEALALSEAGLTAAIERSDPVAPGPARDGESPTGSQPITPSAPATIADLGQQKLAATGCPHCGQADIVRWGTASGLPRYRCKACTRTFNALTKTPLARLRMREKWTQQATAMIDGVSLTKAAERCGVDRTTAFRWRHRFLAALSHDKPKTLNGIVESDETFVLESFKGKRSALPRKARKRGSVAAKRGLSAEQIPVIVARDRDGTTTDAVLPRLNRVSIAMALDGVVTPANAFCCDGGTAIVAFARHAGITAHVLPRPGKPDPRAPQFHLNNVNAYHGRLKEWLRRFHGVATKNLPNYLGWRRTLEAAGREITAPAMILGAMGQGPYQQLARL